MTAHIDPSAIPGDQLDPDGIDTAANAMRSIGQAVSEQGGTVVSSWQGLAAHYEAPEAATLFGVMDPVKTNAETFGSNVGTVASALNDFADEIRPIKAELANLRSQAYDFVNTTVANGVDKTTYAGRAGAVQTHVDWDEDQGAVDKNNSLIAAVNHQMTLLWAAERTCANKIYDTIGFSHIQAASDSNPNGYGVDEIPEGTDMPWGKKVDRKESCGEKVASGVGHFVWDGVIVGGLWGTVKGLGTLVLGYNPQTGEWFSGDAYKAAWSNLGMLGVGLVATSAGGLPLTLMPGPVGDFFRKGRDTVIEAGKSMIAWDKWKDDPAAAAGESVFNIGTLILPGAGEVGAVKTGTSIAAKTVRVAGRVAEVVDPTTWLLKAGVTGVKIAAPVIADLSVGTKLALDNLDDLGKIDLPKIELPKVEVPTVPGGGIDVTTPTGGSALDVPPPRHIETPTELPTGQVREPVLVGGGTHVDTGATHIDTGATHIDAGGTQVGTGAGHVDSGATITTGHGGTGVDVTVGGGRHSGVDVTTGGSATDGTHVTGGAADGHTGTTSPGSGTGGHDGGTPGGGGGGTPPDTPTTGGGTGHDGSNPWDPEQGDPTLSDADHGPGWSRDFDVRGNDIDPNYGQPLAHHGTLAPEFRAPTGDQVPPSARELVTDADASYGRAPDHHPYTQAEYEARYVKPDGSPRYPGNDGAVLGRRIDFTDVDQFRANYGDQLDRFGGGSGSFMSFPDTPFEYRSLPPGHLNAPYSTFELSGHLPPGAKIEVSEIAPAFGRPGGGLQVRVLDVHGEPMTIDELRSAGFFTDPTATPHVGTAGTTDGGLTIDHGTIDHGTIDHGGIDHSTIDHSTVGGGSDHSGLVGDGTVDHGTVDTSTATQPDLSGSGAEMAHTQHVTTTGDGKTPELLLKNLQPDTRYIVDNGSYIYETDSAGRVVYAEGHLDQVVDQADRVRNESEQKLAGGTDRLPADHGGHFFATLFGGPGEGINLTAQHGHVNLSAYKRLENSWTTSIEAGHSVDVRITTVYPAESLRPSAYQVVYQIDGGKPITKVIPNR
jgi:DNA/RNA non-specific endonuclease/Tuberculosis necrotizing toxin